MHAQSIVPPTSYFLPPASSLLLPPSSLSYFLLATCQRLPWISSPLLALNKLMWLFTSVRPNEPLNPRRA